MAMLVINSVTPKAAAEWELLFNKLALGLKNEAVVISWLILSYHDNTLRTIGQVSRHFLFKFKSTFQNVQIEAKCDCQRFLFTFRLLSAPLWNWSRPRCKSMIMARGPSRCLYYETFFSSSLMHIG
jgi:hypothetical protein